LCVDGKKYLYRLLNKNKINYKKTGKYVVAVNVSEVEYLKKLKANAEKNGVTDVRLVSQAELKNDEPMVTAEAALYSPSTGILSAHGLMDYLYADAKSRGAMFSFNSEVIGIERTKDAYKLKLKDGYSFLSRIVINSAGLNSDKIAQFVGIDIDKAGYKLKYCKGDYFTINKNDFINHLIYPVPDENSDGLGIHATPDLSGVVKLGPDVDYVDEINYEVRETKKEKFFDAAKKYFPWLEIDFLSPDTSGIRPKLHGKEEGFRDFIIKEESDRGFPNFINLIGVESPGLTASLAIGKYIKDVIL
jgi:L-2-hydroxyglutarate oxidase LhgO